MSRAPLVISSLAARRLLLGAQGLFDDPTRPATPAALRRLILALGFVQVDSINTVARAHHLTLHSRLDGYHPRTLTRLLERDRFLFEHWTHDASIIPTAWYAHWKPRFTRDRPRIEKNAWWQKLLGPERARVTSAMLDRITRDGPLRAADLDTKSSGGFWAWTPEKAALEYLWRVGDLAVHARHNFQKVYDLPTRVLPAHHPLPEPDAATHLTWACSTAADRLVVFTPRELAHYWGAVSLADARSFCVESARRGQLVEAHAESADGSAPQPVFALADWEARLAALPEAPDRLRLLAPFDPIIRDRDRARRRFGFDYTFEAYTPAKKRRFGYYVLPMLEGDRLVGRVDPILRRDEDRLVVQGVWWEPGIRATKARKRSLDAALARLAAFAGATRVDWA
ncbi:Hypothetical protein A7982_05918 [Minicystis rosea]|nr:Hypothetical protein A7982_05918 [Minicystis rosea]